jgi:hypothetical protein
MLSEVHVLLKRKEKSAESRLKAEKKIIKFQVLQF